MAMLYAVGLGVADVTLSGEEEDLNATSPPL